MEVLPCRGAGEAEHRAFGRGERAALLQHFGHGRRISSRFTGFGVGSGRTPRLRALHSRVHGGVPGDQDDRGAGYRCAKRRSELLAVHAAHLFRSLTTTSAGASARRSWASMRRRPWPRHSRPCGSRGARFSRALVFVVHTSRRALRRSRRVLAARVLEDELLDLGQAVMAGVEDGLGPGQVQVVHRGLGPRQAGHELEPVEADGVFGAGRASVSWPGARARRGGLAGRRGLGGLPEPPLSPCRTLRSRARPEPVRPRAES
jgi:hypothetical protein